MDLDLHFGLVVALDQTDDVTARLGRRGGQVFGLTELAAIQEYNHLCGSNLPPDHRFGDPSSFGGGRVGDGEVGGARRANRKRTEHNRRNPSKHAFHPATRVTPSKAVGYETACLAVGARERENATMGVVVFVNGQAVPPEDARVSVFDRGFLYGDSVYEVIRTYGGIPFEVDAHVTRLAASAAHIGMTLPVSLATLTDEISAAVAVPDHPESYVRVVITRGAGPIGLDPNLAVDPVRVLLVQPLPAPTPEQYAEGVTIAVTGVRRNLKAAINPAAKTGNYLNSVLALAEAKKKGAYEAVMLDHRELITEGSSSNIFAVLGDRLITPPLAVGLLAGITRSVVLRIAHSAGLRPIEAPLSVESLIGADEVMLTSTIREILPVVRVNDHAIGDGRPGAAYRRLRQAFAAHVAEHNARYEAARAG